MYSATVNYRQAGRIRAGLSFGYFKGLEDCFSSLFGRAGTETLIPFYPINARNRRLSISLLRGMGEENSTW